MEAINENPGCILGMSALLTTTMESMEKAVKQLRQSFPSQKILVGGAPLNKEFALKIGADLYAPNPQVAVEYINAIA